MKSVLLTFFCSLASLTLVAQPSISFDQTTKDLGTLLWHTPRSVEFKFTNQSTRDIRLTEVLPDCGCTQTMWSDAPIQPGASGVITAVYDAELLGHFQKSLVVFTDQSEEPIYLTLMGTVSQTQSEPSVEYPYQIGDFFLSTDDVEFDDVNRGDSPIFPLYILNSSKKSYRPELMHLPKYLTASYDPEVILPGRMGRVMLTLDSQQLPAMGLTQTSIYLSRFMGDRVGKENEINVSATLLPDFLDTPTQHALAPCMEIDSTSISVGLLNKKGKASQQLVIRNTGKTPLLINALQVYNPGISVSIGSRRIDPGEEQKLKVSVTASSDNFKGRRRILLITNDPKRPKTVIEVTIKK